VRPKLPLPGAPITSHGNPLVPQPPVASPKVATVAPTVGDSPASSSSNVPRAFASMKVAPPRRKSAAIGGTSGLPAVAPASADAGPPLQEAIALARPKGKMVAGRKTGVPAAFLRLRPPLPLPPPLVSPPPPRVVLPSEHADADAGVDAGVEASGGGGSSGSACPLAPELPDAVDAMPSAAADDSDLPADVAATTASKAAAVRPPRGLKRPPDPGSSGPVKKVFRPTIRISTAVIRATLSKKAAVAKAAMAKAIVSPAKAGSGVADVWA